MHQSLKPMVAKLEGVTAYRTAFQKAFGASGISAERVGLALEQFMLTLIAADSKFDRAARWARLAATSRKFNERKNFVMQKQNTSVTGASRRDFIKKTSIAAAAVAATGIVKTPVYGADTAPSTGRVIGANDRITVAIIGVGYGIGQDHIIGIQENAGDNNVVVAAGCDLFSKRRNWMMGKAEQYKRTLPQPLKDADVYEDYRKVLDRKDIDAVVVATHDVWHANITCDALQAGKHVYCEKPMTRYLGEAFRVHDLVKQTGKILQVGSQGCSAGGWHKAAELIQAGKIGTLVWSQGYYCRNKHEGEWNYDIDDDTKAARLRFVLMSG